MLNEYRYSGLKYNISNPSFATLKSNWAVQKCLGENNQGKWRLLFERKILMQLFWNCELVHNYGKTANVG